MMKRDRLAITLLTAGIFVLGVVAFWRLQGHLHLMAQGVYCMWILALWMPTIAMWKAPLRANERDWPHYQAMMADVLVLVALLLLRVVTRVPG
jgi:hypothetical protein